jgi:hypothetical protein
MQHNRAPDPFRMGGRGNLSLPPPTLLGTDEMSVGGQCHAPAALTL